MQKNIQVLKLILGISLVFATPFLSAAGPITHALLAEKWIKYREQYTPEQKKSFVLGTLFPDIRYLGVIERDKTHEKNLALADLLAPQTEFTKGKRLHAFVDELREKFIVNQKIYDTIKTVPGQEYKAMFLKLLEDEILFSKQNWAPTLQSLATIDEEERKYNISEEHLQKWHRIQAMTFTQKPSEYLADLSAQNKGFGNVPIEITRQWIQILPKLAADAKMKQYVENMLQEFDKTFEKKN